MAVEAPPKRVGTQSDIQWTCSFMILQISWYVSARATGSVCARPWARSSSIGGSAMFDQLRTDGLDAFDSKGVAITSGSGPFAAPANIISHCVGSGPI